MSSSLKDESASDLDGGVVENASSGAGGSPDAEVVTSWLTAFESALNSGELSGVGDLFVEDSHWRDMGAFTGDLGGVSGRERVERLLTASIESIAPVALRMSASQSPPVRVARAGRDVLEAYFDFETRTGSGTGLVRLMDTERGAKAWTLLTRLEGVAGVQPIDADHRPQGVGFDRSSGTTWSVHREQSRAYADRDPEVLVVGGGHHGLFTAAYLQALGVDVLVVDKLPRIGDNWRGRYASLALHNRTEMCHFPFLPFPDAYPQYLPKDMLANWFEVYVEAMQLNYWASTEMIGGTYDPDSLRWEATLRTADGSERIVRPRHIVMGTGGVGSRPNIPDLPGLSSFGGEVMHSSQFDSGARFAGKRVLVVGVATSGHDTARELYLNGAEVVMLQRAPVTIVRLETSELAYSPAYFDGSPLEEADYLSMAGFINPILKEASLKVGQMSSDRDRDLHEGLERAGLHVDPTPDGWIMKLYNRFAGYYLDVGASQLIVDGQIEVRQLTDIRRFVSEGIEFADGRVERFDAVVLATGYVNQRTTAAAIFGTDVADKVGDIGGIDEVGELRNTYKPTAQRGLWFTSSGIASGRTLARHMAALIAADINGVATDHRHGFIAANGGTYA